MTIGFVEQSYKVVEGEGGVTLEVEVMEGEIPAEIMVEVTIGTTDLSANGVMLYTVLSNIALFNNLWHFHLFDSTAITDYLHILNRQLHFTAWSNHAYIFIPIIDDTDIEDIKRFHADLHFNSSLFPDILLNPVQATVEIFSNDCM